ncbi:hypothetical protein [Aureispira sp. CCB-QB1]|uniref:hypothetical protein n=1 Tax=Aureispira sp. CCB-QB1 TaxID=1313421 RepID=UPI000696899E|nr:hypothetical protein [Aureispira sp. CCB-QB1]
MKSRTKVFIVLLVLALGGVAIYQWQQQRNEPIIKIVNSNQSTKEVAFKMSYKDMKFESSLKLGGVRRQKLGNYTFEAVTQGQKIVLSIKDNNNKALTTKTVTFA